MSNIKSIFFMNDNHLHLEFGMLLFETESINTEFKRIKPMKCGQLNTFDLAQAYAKALQQTVGTEVDIETLAPHLKEIGSSCGVCPALLPLAKKAFEHNPDILAGSVAREETARGVVREDVAKIVPDLGRFIPKEA